MNGLRVVVSRSFELLVLSLVFTSLSPFSSRAGSLSAGERVRIQHTTEREGIGGRPNRGLRWTKGVLVSASEDRIIMTTDSGDRASFPLSDITRIDRQAGTHRHALAGAVIGAAIGAPVGMWVASETVSDTWSLVGVSEEASSQEKAEGALIGGSICAAIGALAGYLTVTDKWEAASPHDVSLEMLPAGHDAFTLSATVRF